MSDKVVFLDFDGVINNRKYLMTLDPVARVNNCFDQMNIYWLNRITNETGAKIVVSSSWRHFNLDLRAILKNAGVEGEVIGETPKADVIRGMEIGMWLRDNQWVKKFVILDDDEDMGYISDGLVRTSFETGLLGTHYADALALLA